VADPYKTETDEYLVVAHTTVEPLAEMDERRRVKDIYSVSIEDIRTKVTIENYGEARYRLLAVALRIRNYAAYFTRSQHPLSFRMVGERDAIVNPSLFTIGAVFDGATHLPFTDGGFGKASVFFTRYGPPEGLKPPYEQFASKESAFAWVADLDNRLRFAGKMLETIPEQSGCDVAISCVGESFWTGEAKDRFLACWRAIDAVAKSDSNSGKANFGNIAATVGKRSKAKISMASLKSLRELRHVAAHSTPSNETYQLYHSRLPEVYELARRLTDSMIREQIGADEELDWGVDDWRSAKV